MVKKFFTKKDEDIKAKPKTKKIVVVEEELEENRKDDSDSGESLK